MPPLSQDHQLSTWIERAGAGDPRALEHLLSTHSARLASYISPKLPAPMQGAVDVDDILQQTFLEVFRSIGHFEPRGDDSFWSWIVAIADARLRDAIKSQERIKRGGNHHRVYRRGSEHRSSVADLIELLSTGDSTPSRVAACHENVEAMEQAIAELPDDYRQAVKLRLLEARRLDDVALIMGRSPRAIQGIIDRAKKKLRAALARLSV